MPQSPSSDWFRVAFGELYPVLYAHRDDTSAAREVTALMRVLGLAGSGALTLDLCCGDGRHAAALSELGLRVLGYDLSPELLVRAKERSCLRGRLVRGDMRRLPYAPVFDLVVNLFTSFGYFEDDAENAGALREMARTLRPGGRLVIDHMNRSAVERTLVPEDSRAGPGFVLRQRRQIAAGRVRKEMLIDWDDGRRVRMNESVRMYKPEEMLALLSEVGLTAAQLLGSFAGDALTRDSARMIATARKPDVQD